MIAVHLEEGQINIRHRRKPRRPGGHALIRLRQGGICNTDLELLRGYSGFSGTPGHEFVGEVVAADSQRWLGKRVVGEINLACGACSWCESGLGRHCPQRSVVGIVRHAGAFSEYFTLPEENLHTVPRAVSDEHAVFAEPVAAACEILDQVKIPKGAEVAVLGDGKLGLLISQVLKLHGADAHLYGRHPEKLSIAQRAGVRCFPEGGERRAGHYGWVVEATGSAQGLQTAVSMTQPRGFVVLKSTVAGAVSLDTAPVVVNEITVVGSRCGRFEPALRLLASGRLRLDEMISARYPLSEAVRAFERAQRRGTLKVLLQAG